MKANELMIGDLVTFKDCQNDKHPIIVKIWQINADGDAFASIDGSDALDEISIDDEVVGIPLTPEILEKNGWHNHGPRYYENYSVEFELQAYHDDGGFGIVVPSDEYGSAIFTDIKYVHELQHALRLCRIDKEIAL